MRHAILFLSIWIVLTSPGYAEVYKWVDERGTVHFADDLSKIPEKYRPEARIQKLPQESPAPGTREEPTLPLLPPPAPEASEPEGVEVDLLRRGGVLWAEVVLNRGVTRRFVVDSGASFTLINQETAKELNLTIDEDTPFVPMATASDVIFVPLVTLKSVRVGNAEVEDVDALIHTMPGSGEGLLGNSFLNKFRVLLDSTHGKMTLLSKQGKPSSEQPGGHDRDYWVGQFRFCQENLAGLKRLKAKYESQGAHSLLKQVNHTIRYFENRLDDLERKASFAGVPRNWRE